MPPMKRAQLLLAPLAAAGLLEGCTVFQHTSRVSIASEPPGALVLVDGRDSGFVTPCLLELEREDDVRLELQYPGYVTATRILTKDNQVYAILWSEMFIRPPVWNFPLWLNTRDLFVPVKWDKTFSPGRLYVKLERVADA